MAGSALATLMLRQEADSLLTRLDQMAPFALKMPMVPAAALTPSAQIAIELHVGRAKRELRALVQSFLQWLGSATGQAVPASEAQRRFALLKLRFNSVLDDFDIFADVVSQRSEHGTGVWVSGLDVVAADALAMPSVYTAPPVICYLDRGHGAAIRRARTRLPGGEENPVAIIRVPRERMVGSGIASSLVHEVGHQGAALLQLVESFRPVLRAIQDKGGPAAPAWELYDRWISEILADFWSVARVGVGSTLGLIGVVSLPRFFVFRTNIDDPHPIPWIRVILSCAMGQALFPHPQWARLAALWRSYYPPDGLAPAKRQLFTMLESTMPAFVSLLANHRPPSLRGRTVADALEVGSRQPAQLRDLWSQWRGSVAAMRPVAPSLVFAAISQARADAQISPAIETRILSELLTNWALDDALGTSQSCAERRRSTIEARSIPSSTPTGLSRPLVRTSAAPAVAAR
ncbi:MAG TPA: hypothetical protein VLT84_01680 [Acidobacteriota bacterium]|nr:hypothetical protein [Acidobacteriota bacterium]